MQISLTEKITKRKALLGAKKLVISQWAVGGEILVGRMKEKPRSGGKKLHLTDGSKNHIK